MHLFGPTKKKKTLAYRATGHRKQTNKEEKKKQAQRDSHFKHLLLFQRPGEEQQ